MQKAFCLIPYRRRLGVLAPQREEVFQTEAQLFRHGRAVATANDGVAFFRIECREDGDYWEPVECLTTVGEVPGDPLLIDPPAPEPWEADAA